MEKHFTFSQICSRIEQSAFVNHELLLHQTQEMGMGIISVFCIKGILPAWFP